jgi:hypothetical protein
MDIHRGGNLPRGVSLCLLLFVGSLSVLRGVAGVNAELIEYSIDWLRTAEELLLELPLGGSTPARTRRARRAQIKTARPARARRAARRSGTSMVQQWSSGVILTIPLTLKRTIGEFAFPVAGGGPFELTPLLRLRFHQSFYGKPQNCLYLISDENLTRFRTQECAILPFSLRNLGKLRSRARERTGGKIRKLTPPTIRKGAEQHRRT